MTYREHSVALAWHLTTLATTNSSRQLDDASLGVALLVRHETLRLIHETTALGTGRTPPSRQVLASVTGRISLADVARDPVRAFEQTVHAYPVIRPEVAYTDIDPDRLDEAGRTWRQAARAAILARHDLAAEASAYTGDHRWALIADAAAFTPLLQRLDLQLLDSARRRDPGTGPTVQALSLATTSPAALLASEVNVLAQGGRLPNLPALALPPASTQPVRVDSPATLLEAQRRLPAQLRAAEDISPSVIARTTIGQAYLLHVAATVLHQQHYAPDAASTAREIAGKLARIRPEPRDVAPLVAGDTTPLVQSRAMTTYLTGRRAKHASGVDLVAMRAVIHHAPTVIDALARAADKQLATGRWLTPASHPDLRWDAHHGFDDPPRLVIALRAIREQYPAQPVPARAHLDSARAMLATMRPRTRVTRPDSPAIAVTPPRHGGPSLT